VETYKLNLILTKQGCNLLVLEVNKFYSDPTINVRSDLLVLLLACDGRLSKSGTSRISEGSII